MQAITRDTFCDTPLITQTKNQLRSEIILKPELIYRFVLLGFIETQLFTHQHLIYKRDSKNDYCFTILHIAEEIADISSMVLSRPREIRIVPSAIFSGTPIACNT